MKRVLVDMLHAFYLWKSNNFIQLFPIIFKNILLKSVLTSTFASVVFIS